MGMPHLPGRSKHAPTFGLRAVFAGIGRLLLLADRPEATLVETGAGPGGKAEPQHRSTAGRPARPGRVRSGQPDSRWRSLDKTGNVRLLSEEDLDDDLDAEQFALDEAAVDEAAVDEAVGDLTIEQAAAVEAAVEDLVEELAVEASAPASLARAEPARVAAASASATPAPATPAPATRARAMPAPATSMGRAAVAAEAATVLPLPNYDELSLASIRARLRGLDASQLRILADHERRNAERPEVLGMLERRIEKLAADG